MRKNKKIIWIFIALCILGTTGAYIIMKHNEIVKEDLVTFTFDSNGGSTVKIIKTTKGSEVDLPNCVREGYAFIGWFVKDQKASEKVNATKNTTFKAAWEKLPETTRYYIISFDSTGGTEVEDLVMECGKKVTLPENITRKGYTFITWLDEESNPINNDSLLNCEDITLSAKWKKGN